MGNFNNISQIMDGYSPYKEMREKTKGLVEKWKQTGLLDSLNEEQEVHGMAILLENQARQLIDESSRTGAAANSEEWSGVALPLVRKVFGEIAAKDFVSVQPMNLPSGLIFYLEFTYGTDQPGSTTDASVFGTTNTSADASGGLYGAGKFGYSINDKSSAALYVSGAVTPTATSASYTDATWADVNFNQPLSASAADGTLQKLTVATASFTNPDFEGVRGFDIAGDADNHYPAQAKTDLDNGNIIFFVDGLSDGDDVTLRYHSQPTDITRGDFEVNTTQDFSSGSDTSGKDVGIPEIDINMTSVPIVAKTRKLKAVWTPELAQDLNAYHSVDAEAELTSLLSEYISMEIDLEILDMLMLNALTTEYWSARVGHEYDSVAGTFSLADSGGPVAYQKSSWYQTLGVKVQKVSNKIHQKTMRGGANFLVCGPDVATILESIPGFAVDTDGNKPQFAMGVQKVGVFNNRFNVYKNPYMKENVILIGFRGSNFLETGAVYAPYIPLIMTPLIYDPVNFTPRKGVMTRYAKKIVRPEFYGKIVVHGLDYV